MFVCVCAFATLESNEANNYGVYDNGIMRVLYSSIVKYRINSNMKREHKHFFECMRYILFSGSPVLNIYFIKWTYISLFLGCVCVCMLVVLNGPGMGGECMICISLWSFRVALVRKSLCFTFKQIWYSWNMFIYYIIAFMIKSATTVHCYG